MIFLTKTKSITMNFEVGKKVICIQNHITGIIKKGETFTLQGIKAKKCGCKGTLLDIGLFHPKWAEICDSICSNCWKVCNSSTDRNMWLSSVLFAPYDDSLSSLTVEMILDEETILKP